jgi:nitrate/nitrite transporter NarK
VSAVASRLASGVGAGGAALVAAVQPGLLVPVTLVAAVLGGLPLLLITTLALVAVYSHDPDRRTAAENILDRLLSALRPRERPPTRQRRKGRPTRNVMTVKSSGSFGDEAPLSEPEPGDPAR